MMVCPHCSRSYSIDYSFCLDDGNLLTDADVEQETIVNRKPEFVDLRNVPKQVTQPKNFYLQRFMYVFGIIAVLGTAAIFALIYFFYYAVRTADGLN